MEIITYLPCPKNASCLPNKRFDYMLMDLPVIASNFPLYRDWQKESQKLLQIYNTVVHTEGGH